MTSFVCSGCRSGNCSEFTCWHDNGHREERKTGKGKAEYVTVQKVVLTDSKLRHQIAVDLLVKKEGSKVLENMPVVYSVHKCKTYGQVCEGDKVIGLMDLD